MRSRRNRPARLARLATAVATAWLAIAWFWAPEAAAQDISGAANAYSRAQKAALSGDHAEAAELYELADSLAPAPEALRSALRARKAAGQLKSAAVHAESLLSRYPEDDRSRQLAEETLEEAAQSLARYEISCSPTPCQLEVDGAAAGTEPKEQHLVFMDPGPHDVVAVFDAQRTDPQVAEGEAGDRGSLAFEAPPRPPEPDPATAAAAGSTDPRTDSRPPPRRGLSPGFFAVGAIVTAGLAGATVWSGLDVLNAHDKYEKNQTESAYRDGKDRERRTNILIGATAAAGVATGVFAILTQWKRPKSTQGVRAGFDVGTNGGVISVSGMY